MRIASLVLIATLVTSSTVGAFAAPIKPGKTSAKDSDSFASKKKIEGSVNFVVLSQQADREIHASHLGNALATAAAIAKLADSETEAETKSRIMTEVHQIKAEVAIMQAKWSEAEQELVTVKKISSTFAGNEGTGHFDDLLTLIRERQGKCPFGPKESADIDAELAVKTQLRALQVAVEEFAREHQNKYPTKISDLSKGYLDKYGGHFTNPFTKKNELPEIGEPGVLVRDTELSKGKLCYRLTKDGEDYLLYAGGYNNKPVLLENGAPFTLKAEDAPIEPFFHTVNNHPHID